MTIAPGLTGSLDRPTDYARLEFTKRQAASAVAAAGLLTIQKQAPIRTTGSVLLSRLQTL
jgi:hypothetical protein